MIKFIPKQENMMKILDKIETKITDSIVQKAKELAPVGSGKLRNSIKSKKKDNNLWEIVADVPYSYYVEMGTSHEAPHPFLRPATYAWQRGFK
jgi:HK97 gp10 family phage protein